MCVGGRSEWERVVMMREITDNKAEINNKKTAFGRKGEGEKI